METEAAAKRNGGGGKRTQVTEAAAVGAVVALAGGRRLLMEGRRRCVVAAEQRRRRSGGLWRCACEVHSERRRRCAAGATLGEARLSPFGRNNGGATGQPTGGAVPLDGVSDSPYLCFGSLSFLIQHIAIIISQYMMVGGMEGPTGLRRSSPVTAVVVGDGQGGVRR
ncbi:hypothetical protein U1Q18_001290 [Sarracenia purpurea var. burkii]